MKRRLGQLLALLCGTVMFLTGVFCQDPYRISDAREWLRIASNAALLPGVLFVGLSAMMWISGEGLFDGIRYTMTSMMARLRGADKQYASYYDYTQREKKNTSHALLLPGLFFLAVAILLTLLFYL